MELKIIRKQNNSAECIVCGTKNNSSLKANFYDTENNLVVGKFLGKDLHQSYPERMHGGMICAILDEVIGRAIQHGCVNTWGVTIDINVKYRKPVPLNAELLCVGKIVKETSLSFTGAGFIEDKDGNLLATAIGKYMKLPPEKISSNVISPENWYQFVLENEPKTISVNNLHFFDNI